MAGLEELRRKFRAVKPGMEDLKRSNGADSVTVRLRFVPDTRLGIDALGENEDESA